MGAEVRAWNGDGGATRPRLCSVTSERAWPPRASLPRVSPSAAASALILGNLVPGGAEGPSVSSAKPADNAAGSATERSDGAAGEADYCPSAEEVVAYWDKYHRERKPSPGCSDPDPLLEDPSGEPEDPGEPAVEPRTLDEAQELFDPNNEPLILVDQQADGTFMSVNMTVWNPEDTPPASIQTSQQYKTWLEEQHGQER